MMMMIIEVRSYDQHGGLNCFCWFCDPSGFRGLEEYGPTHFCRELRRTIHQRIKQTKKMVGCLPLKCSNRQSRGSTIDSLLIQRVKHVRE